MKEKNKKKKCERHQSFQNHLRRTKEKKNGQKYQKLKMFEMCICVCMRREKGERMNIIVYVWFAFFIISSSEMSFFCSSFRAVYSNECFWVASHQFMRLYTLILFKSYASKFNEHTHTYRRTYGRNFQHFLFNISICCAYSSIHRFIIDYRFIFWHWIEMKIASNLLHRMTVEINSLPNATATK